MRGTYVKTLTFLRNYVSDKYWYYYYENVFYIMWDKANV